MYGPLEPWLNKTWRPSEIERWSSEQDADSRRGGVPQADAWDMEEYTGPNKPIIWYARTPYYDGIPAHRRRVLNGFATTPVGTSFRIRPALTFLRSASGQPVRLPVMD
jgi:hypothetical protein